MVLMRWSRAELRRQPAEDVRALLFRVAAPHLVADLATAEEQLKDANETDLTKVATGERSALRRRRKDLTVLVAELSDVLGRREG